MRKYNPAVDKAESDSTTAHAINGFAVGVLAAQAKQLNALLVHYSTDYVFNGSVTLPWVETDTHNSSVCMTTANWLAEPPSEIAVANTSYREQVGCTPCAVRILYAPSCA